jgi:hypothetical protein
MNATATSNGTSRRRKATRLPDDWQTEALICPDEHCHHLIVNADRIKGNPYCAGPSHKITGHYPRLERVVLGIQGRPA